MNLHPDKKKEKGKEDVRRLKTQKVWIGKIWVHPSICFLVAHIDELTCRSNAARSSQTSTTQSHQKQVEEPPPAGLPNSRSITSEMAQFWWVFQLVTQQIPEDFAVTVAHCPNMSLSLHWISWGSSQVGFPLLGTPRWNVVHKCL